MNNNQSVHHACMQVRKAYMNKKRTVFAKYQLNPTQPQILKFLKFNEGCSQKELAEYCSIEQATATSILTTLENQGLIVRKPCSTDKRRLRLYLTDLGHEKVEHVVALLDELEQLSQEGFTEAEKIQFISFLNRLANNLSKK